MSILRPVMVCMLLIASLSLPAHAFERPFPQIAKRGTMTPDLHPHVTINGKQRTLSAGARIWNQDNMIEMPAALRGSDLAVRYTEDMNGEVDRIWLLTDDEIKRPPAKDEVEAMPLPAPLEQDRP
ncbi:hypothetical protein GCM10007205_26240 [Oxalicibacterium flavum]|uniref:Uncharacterized protein n=1 Tax=Oxalicibacterium flavum TaxID=179467 RepID=A0A8J2UPF6_9BURK|nr:hypothetical protein [Oxalicibacterium flavum]GGC16019.1 hypothetical protein GCM10007205_26240 [Oxalicibacterium flavum]